MRNETNESTLRWRARIGALKPLATGALLCAIVGLLIGFSMFSTTLKNPGGPIQVTIRDLVEGRVSSDRYVTVRGRPMYDMGYEETRNGSTTALYYLLLDDQEGFLITVKANTLNLPPTTGAVATVTGMTLRLV